jgi:hypothetical protein
MEGIFNSTNQQFSASCSPEHQSWLPDCALRDPQRTVTTILLGNQKLDMPNIRSQWTIGRGFQFELNRTNSPDYNLNVSRAHAILTREKDGTFSIEDLNSTHGTYIRSRGEAEFRRINSRETITSADEIMLGGTCETDIGTAAWSDIPGLRKGTKLQLA